MEGVLRQRTRDPEQPAASAQLCRTFPTWYGAAPPCRPALLLNKIFKEASRTGVNGMKPEVDAVAVIV